MKIEGGQQYRLRLVTANCHREEQIFEIVSVLDHLNVITTEIFTKIQQRIRQQNVEVESLTNRLSTAAAKVSLLKNSSKPIHILSPAKFPESTECSSNGGPELYPTIVLRSLETEPCDRTSADIPPSKSQTRQVLYDSSVKQNEDFLQYHGMSDSNIMGSHLSRLGTKYEPGLGNPPESLEYLDSFILFNANTNPYENYVVSDSSGVGSLGPNAKGPQKVNPILVDTNGVHGKEGTSTTEQAQNKDDLDDFYYYPSSVQVPQIDLPEHLPSLPGLSDAFSVDFTPEPIAFSSRGIQRTESTVSQLPIDTNTTNAHPPTESIRIQEGREKNNSPFIPPPPPPPLPAISVVPTPSSLTHSVPLVSFIASSSHPPPPPPPPPPPAAPPQQSSVTPVPPLTISFRNVAEAVIDSRSTLMAAIRDAGGKSKLKPSKKITAEADVPNKVGAGESGGDLLEDLKNSLAMRRRGISGQFDTGRSTGIGDIMKKMASSMPLPAEDDAFDSRKASLSDDDWD